MKHRFTATALFLASLIPHTSQAQQVEVYTLTVTTPEVVTIGQALGELPYKTAAPLLNKLNEQITKQNADKAKARELEEKPNNPEGNK